MSILKSLLKTAIATLLLICVSSASFASESSKSSINSKYAGNFYVGLSLGQIVPINDLLSKSISVSAGYKINKDVSAELEGVISFIAEKDRESLIPALMANAYYHFNNSSNFTPYVGFGIGLAQPLFYHFDGLKSAYQGKVGVSYSAGNATELFAGYRFLNVLNAKKPDPREVFTHKAIEIGLKYNI
ncbi:outer membrane beta-barrel protein [Wolbachia endosymbiont of Ctenocephalides felis wCfeT]|uniref:outer membrane beta-barrel protein n=1 Tax=Wolbachia endosymbiont of Ctenocephalides felis wCfeT TaxID=2732593 RepID=UPI001444B3B2|nr:outer membrane beta-barrel protein [Wolbachia endosymbiont of Ctenocephalides felis wCfeT]